MMIKNEDAETMSNTMQAIPILSTLTKDILSYDVGDRYKF